MGFDAIKKSNKYLVKRVKELEKIKVDYKQIKHDLGERVKELHCMYAVTQLIERYPDQIDRVFQGVADIIPSSWQYPAITQACITFRGKKFCTSRFKKSKYKQSADIIANKEKIGQLDVYYTKKMPKSDEGPFLKEERALINGIVKRLGSFIEREQALRMLKQSQSLLQKRNKDLNKKNIALKELVDQFEIEKKNLSKKVSANAQKRLLPLISRLKSLNVPNEYISVLEQNVNQLTSEFGANITKDKFKLSAREIEVSNMIRSGLSSKQIAQMLSLSFQTVEAYRKSIRYKLNLTNQSINLASYLKEI